LRDKSNFSETSAFKEKWTRYKTNKKKKTKNAKADICPSLIK